MIRVGRRFYALLLLLIGSPVIGQGVTLPEITRVELDNGAVLLLHEKHDVPLIGVEAIIRGGAVSDPEGMAGLSSLLAGLLQKGAGDRDAAAFAEAVAAVGGELAATADLESLSISGEFMSRDAPLMVELLADMLQRPTLDAGEMAKLRDRSINLIRAAKDADLPALLPLYGAVFLFGDHPYGRPVGGSEESLAKIRHRDVLGYYNDHVGADRLIIAVVGDFETAAMTELLTGAFAEWRQAGTQPPGIEAPAPEPGRRVLLVDKPGATQTYFWLAGPGVAANYPRRAELNIANTVFGGRFTSMLNNALRVESGLTYGARAQLTRPSLPGSVAIFSYTKTESTVEAIDMAIGVLDTLLAEGISGEMLESAKNYILGQYAPQLETSSQLAGMVSYLELMGLDAAYINDYGPAIAAADSETISAVIDEVYTQPGELVFVLLGDAAVIREDIARYGAVTEIAITEPRFRP